MRDSNGKVLFKFSSYIGVQDPNSAEILAIHKACSLYDSNSSFIGKDIIIVSVSKVAVSWINNDSFGSLNHLRMIYDIRAMLSYLGRTFVIFNSRA